MEKLGKMKKLDKLNIDMKKNEQRIKKPGAANGKSKSGN